MNNIKKLFIIILVVLLSFSISACTPHDPEPETKNVVGFYTNGYYSFSKECYPTLTLYDDNTFELNERNGQELAVIKGTYSVEDSDYTFKDENNKYNFTMGSNGGDYLILTSDILDSKNLHFFIKDYKEKVKIYDFIYKCEDSSPEYYPIVTWYSDYSCEFTENLYEGLGIYKGHAEVDIDNNLFYIVCDTYRAWGEEAKSPVEKISFDISGGDLYIKDDLVMSRKGSKFEGILY